MRRFQILHVLALSVCGVMVASAQHTGPSGHGGSNFHGGRQGAPSGTTISTLSNRAPSAGQLIYPTPIGLQQRFSGYTGINRGAIPNNSIGRGHRGYGYGYGGFLVPYVSTFDDYSIPYAPYNTAQDPAAQTANVTANLLGEQIERLSSQVDALRAERAAATPPPGPYQDPPQPAADPVETSPLVLVLRTGQQVQLKSYAIMGQEVWDFSKQPAKKIALSLVNLQASKAATERGGGEFPQVD